MQSTLVEVMLVLVRIAAVLALAWLVPFSALVYLIQRRHPIYYKKINQPYTWFSTVDISLKYGGLTAKRCGAWWRYLAQVYRAIPPLVYRDATCRRVAKVYRHAAHVFLVFSAAVAVFIVPLVCFAAASDGQSALTPGSTGTARTFIPSAQTTESNDESADAQSTSAPSTNTHKTVSHSTTTVTPGQNGTYGTPNTTPITVAQPQPAGPTYLTRANLSSVFASVDLPGQQRARKISVCEQLITQEQPASDLGPVGGGDICTNANLLTYSTY